MIYVIAEITYSTVHECHEVLLGHRLLCAVYIRELHLDGGSITAVSQLCPLGQPREERM